MEKPIGAVDLGGTKIISALFTPQGEPLNEPVSSPTGAQSSPETVVANICDNFRASLERCGRSSAEVCRLGVGVPTTLRYSEGLIDPSPNLPTLSDYPLGKALEERLGLTVALENDANCFILGEQAWGAAKGYANCCGVTLGTGLGLGLILGGKIHHGDFECAGEIWNCPYGEEEKNLEYLASGSALVREYETAAGVRLEGEEIYQRALAGDPAARAVFRGFGRALGHGLSYVVNLLDLGIIVIGGSAARAWELFERPLIETVQRHRIIRNRTRIVRGSLGPLAPLYGAAQLGG